VIAWLYGLNTGTKKLGVTNGPMGVDLYINQGPNSDTIGLSPSQARMLAAMLRAQADEHPKEV